MGAFKYLLIDHFRKIYIPFHRKYKKLSKKFRYF